jgi:hypothetical protein
MLTLEDFSLDDVFTFRLLTGYSLEKGEFKLPSDAINQLREIIERPDITTIEEYKKLLTEILESQNVWHWKLRHAIPWTDLWIIFGICFIFYLIYFKFNIKKPFHWFYRANKTLLIQIIATFGYFFAYIEGCSNYCPMLVGKFPYVKLILPTFVTDCVDIYQQYKYANLCYFFLVYFVCIRNHWPKNRFIRFHWMYGLILDQLQYNYFLAYYPLMKHFEDYSLENAMRGCALASMTILLIYLAPPAFRALTGRYVKNPFLRDAVEVHLGRDNDPDFKWWDRKK